MSSGLYQNSGSRDQAVILPHSAHGCSSSLYSLPQSAQHQEVGALLEFLLTSRSSCWSSMLGQTSWNIFTCLKAEVASTSTLLTDASSFLDQAIEFFLWKRNSLLS